MKALWQSLNGRWGNQLFRYAWARAKCEREGLELRTPPWAGELVFDLPKVSREREGAIIDDDYRQRQSDLIYTRRQAKEWFKIRPELDELIAAKVPKRPFLMHRRVGNYKGNPYLPVVSLESYKTAMLKRGYSFEQFVVSSEELPIVLEQCRDFDFLPDFWRLVNAEVLFRGNSTFSMWAAWLGNAKVYAPVVEGEPGGVESDCEFVEGNYPRCSSHCDFLTDLHLPE